MIRIIPNRKDTKPNQPKFVLSVTIGYGEHCDDMYQDNTLQIINSMDGIWDTWNYVTAKDAEKFFKFFKKILQREKCHHIVLNDAWELNHLETPNKRWYEEYMSDKEIKRFGKFYYEYSGSLFNPHLEHNWYGIVDVNIFYYDENMVKYNCKVV